MSILQPWLYSRAIPYKCADLSKEPTFFICHSSRRNVHIIRRYLLENRSCHIKISQNSITFILKNLNPDIVNVTSSFFLITVVCRAYVSGDGTCDVTRGFGT
jgi:hypothetical protein